MGYTCRSGAVLRLRRADVRVSNAAHVPRTAFAGMQSALRAAPASDAGAGVWWVGERQPGRKCKKTAQKIRFRGVFSLKCGAFPALVHLTGKGTRPCPRRP